MTSLKGTRITWLGHATVLVQTAKGTNILIDPFIQHNPKYPKGFALPEKIHFILLTHGHGDHISDAVPVAKKHKSNVVAIYELAAFIGQQGAENYHRNEYRWNRPVGRRSGHDGGGEALFRC